MATLDKTVLSDTLELLVTIGFKLIAVDEHMAILIGEDGNHYVVPFLKGGERCSKSLD